MSLYETNVANYFYYVTLYLAGHMVDSYRICFGICQHVFQAVEGVENLSEQGHAEKSKEPICAVEQLVKDVGHIANILK